MKMIVEFIIKNNSRPIISLTVDKDASDKIQTDFALFMKSSSPTPDLYFKKYTQEKMEVLIDLRTIAAIMFVESK